jgi:hypothetical protein
MCTAGEERASQSHENRDRAVPVGENTGENRKDLLPRLSRQSIVTAYAAVKQFLHCEGIRE